MQTTLQLIHYGSDKYEKDRFNTIKNHTFGHKPAGGLWTSPIDSKYGWKDWCKNEDFGDLSKSFKLDFKGDLLVIDSIADLNSLPWISVGSFSRILFQNLDCDAIYLTEKGEFETRHNQPRSLYGWDCESVLIMNPDSICEAVK